MMLDLINDTEVMTEAEAREWKTRVGNSANELRVILEDGYRRKAWKALGFLNWSECVRSIADDFDLSERRIWQLHVANRTEDLLNPGSVGEIPEKHLRPISGLPVEQQAEAWKVAVETAPDGKITAAHVQSVVDEIAKKPHVSYNAGNNEWYTPSEYIEAARRVMGVIDMDPASSEIANEVVGADIYHTAQDSGLEYSWSGRVWMNPPYASELVGKFSSKLVFHFAAKEVTEAIVLVNNSTETNWFNDLVALSSAIVFPRGRVRFLDPEGNPGAPLQGQAVIYLGNNPDAFLKEFSGFGWGAAIYGIQ